MKPMNHAKPHSLPEVLVPLALCEKVKSVNIIVEAWSSRKPVSSYSDMSTRASTWCGRISFRIRHKPTIDNEMLSTCATWDLKHVRAHDLELHIFVQLIEDVNMVVIGCASSMATYEPITSNIRGSWGNSGRSWALLTCNRHPCLPCTRKKG